MNKTQQKQVSNLLKKIADKYPKMYGDVITKVLIDEDKTIYVGYAISLWILSTDKEILYKENIPTFNEVITELKSIL